MDLLNRPKIAFFSIVSSDTNRGRTRAWTCEEAQFCDAFLETAGDRGMRKVPSEGKCPHSLMNFYFSLCEFASRRLS